MSFVCANFLLKSRMPECPSGLLPARQGILTTAGKEAHGSVGVPAETCKKPVQGLYERLHMKQLIFCSPCPSSLLRVEVHEWTLLDQR